MNRKSKQRWLSAAALILAAAFIAGYLYVSFFDEESQAFQTEQVSHIDIPFRADGRVSIVDPDGVERYAGQIEIADTDLEREQGLMYRDSLGRDQGMLFVFPEESVQAFWMRNTRISLDIVYIGSDYRIVSIARNARPYDETSLPSQGPAQYVLEINGGLCAELGIQPGDTVRWSLDCSDPKK